MTKGRGKADSGDAAYRMPNRVCATCGRPTGGKMNGNQGGYGDFHHDCRRDEKGNLITKAPERT